jgi:hypothetical protein
MFNLYYLYTTTALSKGLTALYNELSFGSIYYPDLFFPRR